MQYVLFFFKEKTAYEMRISDWSSDVCSSDLQAARIDRQRRHVAGLHLKDVAGVGIARVLESDPGVAAYQEARQQIERVLCADRNQDLVRRRAYAAARQGPGDRKSVV